MEHVDVVIIDDDEGIRWALQQALAVWGLSCCAVSDGKEGFNAVARYSPRLVIVDIKLGAMNGFEVARLIHQLYHDMKILFVTGYKETIAGKVETGGNVIGVLAKPFNIAELLLLVVNNLT